MSARATGAGEDETASGLNVQVPSGQDEPKARKSTSKTVVEQVGQQIGDKTTMLSASSKLQQQKQLAASLRLAANEGKVELVRLLLRCGADVNAQDDEFGSTALHQAAWNGFSETIQVLCKHRASTSIKNKAQFTPLHLACQQGHNQSARLLLMAGAKADARNSYGDTPLHTAARYGHAGVARICLSAKCNPNQVNKNNDTPLHIAAAMGRRKLTKILMQEGAEPAIKNKQNETAMDIALRKDLIEIQELIANPPPDSSRARRRRARQAAELEPASSSRHRSMGQLELLLNSIAPSAATADQLLCSQLYSAASKHCQLRRSSPTDNKNDHELAHSSQRRKQAARRHRLRRHHFRSHEFPHQLVPLDGQLGEKDSKQQQQQQQQWAGQARAIRLAQFGRNSVEPRPSCVGDRWRESSVTPVDAGPPLADGQLATRRQRRRECQFASENALNTSQLGEATNEMAVDVGSSPRLQRAILPLRRLRTRTLATGLGSLCLDAERGQGPSEPAAQKGATFVIRASSVGSARRSLAQQQQQLEDLSANVERAQGDELGPLRTGQLRAGFCGKLTQHKSRSSPTGSARSSQMSKSRGRLVVRPRRLLTTGVDCAASKQQAAVKTARRSVGRLSLLKLRNMVKRRAADDGDDEKKETKREEAPEDHRVKSTATNDERGPQKSSQNDSEQEPKGGASGGRRQQRLGSGRAQEEASCLMRAPNGTKLLATRPLAPLHDDTQLYAIPRKSSKFAANATTTTTTAASKQQVAAESAAPNKRQQFDCGQPANDASAPTPRDTGARPANSPQSPDKDGQSRQEERTIKTTTTTTKATSTTTTLDLVKRANNLAAGSQQQTPQVTAAGLALAGSDSGHSQSSSSCALEPALEEGGQQLEQQQQQQQQQAQTRTSAADDASNSSSGSSYELSSSSNGSSGRHHRASVSPVWVNNESSSVHQQKLAANSAHCELAANLVSVRVAELDDRDFGAPGYSVVRDSHRLAFNGSAACVCPLGLGHDRNENQPNKENDDAAAAESPRAAQKLRQFLHLDSKPRDSSSSLWPVASDLESTPKRADDCAGLLSKVTTNDAATAAAADDDDDDEALFERLKYRPSATDELEREPEAEPDRRLIRPKSALGGASAELIATQRSLAAAAAAKVHRDRLAKMARLKLDEDDRQPLMETSNCRLLTVKTGTETGAFWPRDDHGAARHLNHHELHYRHQSALTNRGHQQQQQQQQQQQRAHSSLQQAVGMMNIITSNAANAPSHRSGTNSVGMSDSSPSNNGAESDNSIQTTTSGSLNTAASDATNCLADKPHECAELASRSKTKTSSSSSGPFGILSRILLNNTSKQASKQAAGKVAPARQDARNSPATAQSGNQRGSNLEGSVCSSSALSSPSISNGRTAGSSTSSQCSPQHSPNASDHQKPKLDQLGSRSRQPIVLSHSNELGVRDEQDGKSAATRPPPESAPKPATGILRQTQQGPACNGFRRPLEQPDALVNGLPRVASYTQLNSMAHQSLDPMARLEQQSNLCNYHALNRSHMIQAKYSPYLPYNLGRYSIHETCDPSASQQHFERAHQLAAGSFYAPSMPTDKLAYSCEQPLANYNKHNHNHNHNHESSINTLSDTSMVCNYSQHDHKSALYVPAYISSSNGRHHFEHQAPVTSAPACDLNDERFHSPARSAHHPNQMHLHNFSYAQNNANSTLVDYSSQRQQQQQRPRSSLDSILLNSASQHQQFPHHEQASHLHSRHHHHQSHGQPKKCNEQGPPARPILVKRSSYELKSSASPSAGPIEVAAAAAAADEHERETSLFNVTQNSIYAGQSMALHKSELVVLPADSSVTVSRLNRQSDDKTIKHKSLVQVGQRMFEPAGNDDGARSSPPPLLPPKTNQTTGKLTTRVSIGSHWTQVENGQAGGRDQSDLDEQEADDFTGATVL